MSVTIGTVVLHNPVVAAPMAGVTDKTYRLLAREMDCALTFTEMVSDKALTYHNQRTLDILDLTQDPYPTGVQLFGSEPEVLAEAAKLAEKDGAALIDINMGCPAPKITKNKEGSALLRDLDRAQAIIEKVVAAVRVPVTVKMRSGWDDASIVAPELARRAQEAGAQGITVHGRTREQQYSGKADWTIIRQVREAVTIPVIGNGDVWTPQDAKRLLEETGCNGIMIGRGSLGNPWLFRRTAHFLATGELLPEPTAAERISLALRHLQLVVEDKGEYIGVRQMRSHLAWYMKGLHGAARLRERVNLEENVAGVTKLLEDYLATEKAEG
jgi:nifR3 family TIM-barrel protein